MVTLPADTLHWLLNDAQIMTEWDDGCCEMCNEPTCKNMATVRVKMRKPRLYDRVCDEHTTEDLIKLHDLAHAAHYRAINEALKQVKP